MPTIQTVLDRSAPKFVKRERRDREEWDDEHDAESYIPNPVFEHVTVLSGHKRLFGRRECVLVRSDGLSVWNAEPNDQWLHDKHGTVDLMIGPSAEDYKSIIRQANSQRAADRLEAAQMSKEARFIAAKEFLLCENKRKTIYKEREQAMALVLHYVMRLKKEECLDLTFMERMEEIFAKSKSGVEMILSLTLLIISLLNRVEKYSEDHIVFGKAKHLSNQILKFVTEHPLEADMKSNLITNYALLQFLLVTEGDADGHKSIRVLFDLISTLDNPQTASHCLHAIGLIIVGVSLPNDMIEEIMPKLVDLLEHSYNSIVSAAATTIAACFQVYDYDEFQVNQIPTDFNVLLKSLNKAIAQSRRKPLKTLLEDVKKTIIGQSSLSSRNKLNHSDISLNHLKNTSMSHIDSWATLLLVGALKTLLGPNTPDYIENNWFVQTSYLKSLRLLPCDYENAKYSDGHSPISHRKRNVARTKRTRQERQLKQLLR